MPKAMLPELKAALAHCLSRAAIISSVSRLGTRFASACRCHIELQLDHDISAPPFTAARDRAACCLHRASPVV